MLDPVLLSQYMYLCPNYILTHNSNTNFLKKVNLLKELQAV